VLDVVDAIPPGRAMSYSDVAAAIGSRAARGVGQVMAYAGSGHPWWRVVKASGHPATDHSSRALEHYRAEGTPLLWSTNGVFRVDLELARHRP
jgi:alkylated DNA nucleotide flippase Atl1